MVKIISFDGKEELEFEICKVIDKVPQTKIKRREVADNFFFSDFGVIEIFDKIDDRFIGRFNEENDSFCLIKDVELKIGDFILFDYASDEEERMIYKVKRGFFEKYKERLNKIERDYDKLFERWYDEDKYNGDEALKEFIGNNCDLTEENFEKMLNYAEKRIEKIKEEEKEKEKREREKKKKEEEKERHNKNSERVGYEKNGRYKCKDFEIDGKKIVMGYTFMLKEDVNKILSFDEIKDFENYNEDNLINILIEKEIDFTLDNKIKVKFNPSVLINDIPVRKSKVGFLIRKLLDNNKIDIKLCNTFSQMAIDTLNQEKLRIDDYDVSCKFRAKDKDNWVFTFMNKDFEMSWNNVRKHFFSDGHSRSFISWFRIKRFFEFIEELGIDKQEALNYMKKVKMMANLNKKDED